MWKASSLFLKRMLKSRMLSMIVCFTNLCHPASPCSASSSVGARHPVRSPQSSETVASCAIHCVRAASGPQGRCHRRCARFRGWHQLSQLCQWGTANQKKKKSMCICHPSVLSTSASGFHLDCQAYTPAFWEERTAWHCLLGARRMGCVGLNIT